MVTAEVQLTNEEVVRITERLEFALHLLNSAESRIENLNREVKSWQKAYEVEMDKRFERLDSRLSASERLIFTAIGAVAVITLIIGSGAAWIALAT